jgi:hypothetical protein
MTSLYLKFAAGLTVPCPVESTTRPCLLARQRPGGGLLDTVVVRKIMVRAYRGQARLGVWPRNGADVRGLATAMDEWRCRCRAAPNVGCCGRGLTRIGYARRQGTGQAHGCSPASKVRSHAFDIRMVR